MDMKARNQYLETIVEKQEYFLKSKKEKGRLLTEYCRNTGQNRKYVIRKLNKGTYDNDTPKKKRKRKQYYTDEVMKALVRCWEIFDYPCGQRLSPSLIREVNRLRKQKELHCTDGTADKLERISCSTIDKRLAPYRQRLHLLKKYRQRRNPLLYQKIPVKLSNEWDRYQLGNVQIDLVEHCGQSARGEYANTLSSVDIASSWWEGGAFLGKGQRPTFDMLKMIEARFPFDLAEIHSDNGSEFINAHFYNYTAEKKLGFSRSRPGKKNDNCYVEQKNYTHVKKYVGYGRYDTTREVALLNDLYSNELRLYKNFFQPVMKLKSKQRIGAKIKRRYTQAKTPYLRVLESSQVKTKFKQELTAIYESLNPAQLKRIIDTKLEILYKEHEKKYNSSKTVGTYKKLTPHHASYSVPGLT